MKYKWSYCVYFWTKICTIVIRLDPSSSLLYAIKKISFYEVKMQVQIGIKRRKCQHMRACIQECRGSISMVKILLSQHKTEVVGVLYKAIKKMLSGRVPE